MLTVCCSQDLQPNDKTRKFAAELFAKIPRKGAAKAYQREVQAKAELARKNEAMTLVEDEDEVG